jgi:uncharacterized membrane protein YphA (DoxX/SURF4 family)
VRQGRISLSAAALHSPALLVARLLVGGIFLVAAVPKIGDPGGFADAVRAYGLLPAPFVVPFALMLPWLELGVALYLLAGYMTRWAGIGAALLLATFTVAIAHALVTGSTAHACGCFGPGAASNPVLRFLAGGSTVTAWDGIRDLILFALCLLLAWRGAGRWAVDRILAR